MRKVKYAAAAAVIMGMTAASAHANPIYVSNVGVPSGEYNLTLNISGSPTNIYYAGLVQFRVNTGTSYNAGTATELDVFCDDLFNDVTIGSSNQYYTASANQYLAPLSLSVIHEIAGLAYQGITYFQQNGATASAAYDADIQLAIWELEYPNDHITDSSLQSAVGGLITQAPTFYANMLAANYSYGQLEDPGCGQSPGTITFNSCQTQGQIYVYSPGKGNYLDVPEPLTISLFGAVLAGAAAAFRRRRKTHNSAA